jgi:hypothetical protein
VRACSVRSQTLGSHSRGVLTTMCMLQRLWRLLGPTAQKTAWLNLVRWWTVHGKPPALTAGFSVQGFKLSALCLPYFVVKHLSYITQLRIKHSTFYPVTSSQQGSSRIVFWRRVGDGTGSQLHPGPKPCLTKQTYSTTLFNTPLGTTCSTRLSLELAANPLFVHVLLLPPPGGCLLLATPAFSTSPTRQHLPPVLPSATQTCVSTSPTTTLLATAMCATLHRSSLSGRFPKPFQAGMMIVWG